MTGFVNFQWLKQAVRMESVLQHYGWKWVRQRGARVQGRCPIHGGQREDAFHADLRRGIFHCFSCQAGGSVLDLVATLERCSLRQAGLRLMAECGSEPAQPSACGTAGQGSQRVRKKMNPLRFRLHPVDSACAYLQQRGIEPRTAKAFGVGYYAGPGMLQGRVVIPIRDEDVQLVAYAGRSVDGTPPKYKLPAGFLKSSVLFNLSSAAALGREQVILVEGFFDCLKVHQAGWPCVVALMGCSLSGRQEALLLKHFSRVVVMLDADLAGQRGADEIAARLGPLCELEVVRLPAGQPDQLPIEELRPILRGAVLCGLATPLDGRL